MELNNLFKNIEFYDLTTEDMDNNEVIEVNLFPYLLIFSIEKSSDTNEIIYSEFMFYVTDDERKKGYSYNNFDALEILNAAKELNPSIELDYNIKNLYDLQEKFLKEKDKKVLKTIFIISLYIMISKFIQNDTSKYIEEKKYIPKEIYNDYLYLVSLELMDKLERYDLD